MQRRDDNELGMMEAVVTKMSRIIAHMGIGEKGKHVVQQLQVSSRAPAASSPWTPASLVSQGRDGTYQDLLLRSIPLFKGSWNTRLHEIPCMTAGMACC